MNDRLPQSAEGEPALFVSTVGVELSLCHVLYELVPVFGFLSQDAGVVKAGHIVWIRNSDPYRGR